MSSGIKPSCVICAWREHCKKQFSISNPSNCPEFSLDVSVKDYPGKKGIKVLIEGEPGSGKTTLVERLITRLKDRKMGGFLTREIKEHGERAGFRIITLDKQEGLLAHVDISGGLKVGKYTVNIEDLENIGVKSVERAIRENNLVVIDEIGKMELFSGRFRDMVDIALNSENQVVATIAIDGAPFVEEIKHKTGVHLISLTKDNRDEVLEEVVRHLEEVLP
jgi:nucleoside-triphosphatase